MKRQNKLFTVIAFVVAIAGFGILSGNFITKNLLAVSNSKFEKLEIFSKVLQYIEKNYVEDVKLDDLIYGALKGMVSSLDPHSSFLTPDLYKEMKIDTAGKFGGLGIEITIKDSILTIIAPIEDTPAYKAGLLPNDKIVEIDNESTKGLNLVEAVKKMRGPENTKVTITIFRDGWTKPKKFTLTRANIKVASVKSMDLGNGYGYVRLTSFQERTHTDMVKALDALESKNNKTLKGLVLDMRSNPGGLLDQAIKISDEYLESGSIVITRGRGEKNQDIQYSKKEGTRANYPIIVLINGESASASEIVAGALQDNGRAVIAGTQSFGKGSVQTVIPLEDGSGLKLTVAKYYTPSGKSIQAKGITPDILLDNLDPKLIEQSKKQNMSIKEKDLKGHFKGEGETDEPVKIESEPADKKDDAAEKEKEKKMTPKEAFENKIKNDFQVSEALNYLKGYYILKGSLEKAKKPTGQK